ncbi:MAG: flavodoxin, partial [Candidatus Omnitrophica bacterium]|nr:flavodoxin [Candidatus Omnitrophota bacterium]
PVWAFAPAPAMNTYLDRCFGLEGKKIILFTTYGSGTGNKRCLNYMQDIVVKKGARGIKRFSVQQFRVKDRNLILSKIKEVV